MSIVKKTVAPTVVATNSFETINVPSGTDPVADSSSDIINFTSADSSLTITGNSGTDTVDFAVRYSNPDAGARSERFGASASAPYDDNTVFGNGALVNVGPSTTSVGCTAIGSNAQTYDQYATAVGFNALSYREGTAFGRNALAGASTVYGCTAFGHGALADADRALAFGNNSRARASSSHAFGQNAESNHAASIVLGYSADSTATNQFVVGGETGAQGIRTMYLGGGVVSSSPDADVSYGVTGGSGSNVVASTTIINGGISTGNAALAPIKFQTGTVGASGSTAQTLTERMRISDAVQLPHISTPANPPSGFCSIYVKSDNKMYILTSAGVETLIGP